MNKPIVGLETYPFLEGYRLVATDGGVFTFGSAGFYGSTGDIKLNQPIVAMTVTPSGNGYWLVAADGGIFTFGDAQFYGSTGAIKLNKPIVGMAATPTGGGYWLVATDGGIFAFGDAEFLGSQGAGPLNKPIVGMETTPDGRGYYLVASDGGIFTHGNAVFRGSRGGEPLNAPIVGMARSRTGNGYQLVATDGGIFNYGDSKFFGSTGNMKLNQPVLGMDIRPAFAVTADAYGTDAKQSSEWKNVDGDFQLVLRDTSAGNPPAGARILGVEGFDVDQLGEIGFTVESGACTNGGPKFVLTYDENGDLTAGGQGTFTYDCTGGGTNTFSAAGPAEVPDNAQVTSLDLVYENNGGATVHIDDIRVGGLTITDFNVQRAA